MHGGSFSEYSRESRNKRTWEILQAKILEDRWQDKSLSGFLRSVEGAMLKGYVFCLRMDP
jgi:hypothetical protein